MPLAWVGGIQIAGRVGRISTELTEGLRFRIFWIMVGLGLINLAGVLFCFIGLIFTMPVTECALCALYLDLKALKAQQTVDAAGG